MMFVKDPEKVILLARKYHTTITAWLQARRIHGADSVAAMDAMSSKVDAATELADFVDSSNFLVDHVPAAFLVAQESDIQKDKGRVGLTLGCLLPLDAWVALRAEHERTGSFALTFYSKLEVDAEGKAKPDHNGVNYPVPDGERAPSQAYVPPSAMAFTLFRCTICGCKWRKWEGEGGWSMAPDEKCGPCCDNSDGFLDIIEPFDGVDHTFLDIIAEHDAPSAPQSSRVEGLEDAIAALPAREVMKDDDVKVMAPSPALLSDLTAVGLRPNCGECNPALAPLCAQFGCQIHSEP